MRESNPNRVVIRFLSCAFQAWLTLSVLGEPVLAESADKTPINMAVTYTSARLGLDPDLIHAVIANESAYDIHAISDKGARGLMQLMPATQRQLGVREVFDPVENIEGGTRYLIAQIRRFGSVRKALWAYNAGPNTVVNDMVPRESKEYANRVLEHYWRLRKSSHVVDRNFKSELF